MSKPRYKWWGHMKAVIRDYPKHYEALHGIKLQSDLAISFEMPANRKLHTDAQKEYDAVCGAIIETLREFEDGELRLKLIDMVFWKRTHTLQGAAMAMYIDYETSKRWLQDFIRKVARGMDLFHPEDKNNQKSQKNVIV